MGRKVRPLRSPCGLHSWIFVLNAALSAILAVQAMQPGPLWAAKADGPVSKTVRFRVSGFERPVNAIYRITGTSDADSIGEGIFARTPEGGFVVVRFAVQNKSAFPVPANILSGITLDAGNGEIISPSDRATALLRMGSGRFALTELAPGGEMADTVVFDVPVGVRKYFIHLPGGKRIGPFKYLKKGMGPAEKTDAKHLPEGEAGQPEQSRTTRDLTKKTPAIKRQPGKEKAAADKAWARPGPIYGKTGPPSIGPCGLSPSAYEKTIQDAEVAGDRALESNYRYIAAECYMLLGRYTDALRNFDMAAKISLSLNDGEMEVLSLLGKSRALAVSGDAKSASEVFSAAADKAETGIFQNLWVVDYLKAFVSYKMADVLAAMGDRELAVKRLQYARLLNYDFALEEKIFKLMSGLDEALHAGIEEIYRLLAEAHTAFEIRDYSNMHKAAASALDKARAMHFRKGIFEAEHALANALTGMGDYKAALDYALHTEDLAESGNDYTRRILSFNLAGDIYMLLKDNERASAEYGKSLSLARVRGNRFDEEKAMARIKQAGLAEASDNISQARPFP